MLLPLEVMKLYSRHDYSLAGAFRSRQTARGNTPFVLQADRSLSWNEFEGQSARVAEVLRAHGVRKGDRVAIMARNHVGHVLILFAVARIGAIMVPINPEFGVDEARYVLSHADVCGVVAAAEVGTVLNEALAGSGIKPWRISLDDARSDAPMLRELLQAVPAGLHQADGAAEDTCVIVYTSGTTGSPKGVMHSQRSFVTAGEAFVQRVRLQPEDRVMVVLPLFHMNALFYSIAGTLAAGCSAFLVPRFSASSFWLVAKDNGCTEVNIIEAIGSILQTRSRQEFVPDHRIRAVYGVRESATRAFREDFGIHQLYSGFGMTEIPGVTCNPYGVPNKSGSMGIIGRHPDPARPWAMCRVVDDNGRDVVDGTIGELAVRTPIIMQGYFRDPNQTASSFRDGWFMTGDLVRRDADGFFFHVSRKKDIIRRRGENIAGAELDRVIGNHPRVRAVATIATPSELGEDEIMAVVVPLTPGAVAANEIAQWCRDRLSAQKVPRFVCFVDKLPYTPTHKIAKDVLRKDASLRWRAVDLQQETAASRS